MSEISVIVPVYKVEKYIRKCIESILNQSFKDFELILVDDGSPDNCPSICDNYKKKDKRVVVIHKVNGGISSARNAGIDYVFTKSKSRYISFVDSDDYVDSTYLEKMHCLITYNDCEMVSCNVCEMFEGSEQKGLISSDVCLNSKIIDEEAYWNYNDYPIFIVCGKLYKKDIFNGLRFIEGKQNEDHFIIHRIIGRCRWIYLIFDKLYYYIRHAESTTYSFTINKVTIDFLDIWLDRVYYYSFEHINDKQAFINFKKAWKEIKHCLVYGLVSYFEYKNKLKTIKVLYRTKYRKKDKYIWKNIIFLYFPKLYIVIHKCCNRLLRAKHQNNCIHKRFPL